MWTLIVDIDTCTSMLIFALTCSSALASAHMLILVLVYHARVIRSLVLVLKLRMIARMSTMS